LRHRAYAGTKAVGNLSKGRISHSRSL